jgi:hypothetical protein
MMRRPLTTLMLVVICAALALDAVLLTATGADVGVSRGDIASVRQSWPLSISAAPGDLALTELSFPAARGQQISGRTLQVALAAPFGDDYLVAGALRLARAGIPRLLVLLVNRPSALLDPVSVHVRLAASSTLGTPLVRRLADPITRSAAHSPVLCDLDLHGSALSASEVLPLHAQGQALAGFDAAAALAQAYDLGCALPYASSFVQAVEQAPAPSSPTAPAPSPPVGRLPGEGCAPTPGYACPASVRSDSRAAGVGGQLGAH